MVKSLCIIRDFEIIINNRFGLCIMRVVTCSVFCVRFVVMQIIHFVFFCWICKRVISITWTYALWDSFDDWSFCKISHWDNRGVKFAFGREQISMMVRSMSCDVVTWSSHDEWGSWWVCLRLNEGHNRTMAVSNLWSQHRHSSVWNTDERSSDVKRIISPD